MRTPDGSDYRRPELLVRRAAGASTPSLREDTVDQQHGHIATDAVRLCRDLAQGRDGRGARGRAERMQLHDIRPGWEVRIAAASEDLRVAAHELVWLPREIALVSPHEELRLLGGQRMIGRDVIGYVVEDQA